MQGVLQKAIEDLRLHQEERREIDPETTAKIDEFIMKLALMSSGISLPFRIIVNDPGEWLCTIHSSSIAVD
jgi:hypothetical protein